MLSVILGKTEVKNLIQVNSCVSDSLKAFLRYQVTEMGRTYRRTDRGMDGCIDREPENQKPLATAVANTVA